MCIVLWVKPRRGRLSPELGGKGPSGLGPGLWAGSKPHTGVFKGSACQAWGRYCPQGSIRARRAGSGADCPSGEALLGKRGLGSELFSGEWAEPGGVELSSRRVGGVQARGPLEAKWAWSRLMGRALMRGLRDVEAGSSGPPDARRRCRAAVGHCEVKPRGAGP